MSDHKTLAVVQAYDGAIISEIPLHDWDAVDAMLERAAKLHAHTAARTIVIDVIRRQYRHFF